MKRTCVEVLSLVHLGFLSLCRTQKLSRDDIPSGRREKEPLERPFSFSTHFTAPRAGPVAAADEQSAAEQRRTGQLMNVIEKLSR